MRSAAPEAGIYNYVRPEYNARTQQLNKAENGLWAAASIFHPKNVAEGKCFPKFEGASCVYVCVCVWWGWVG